MGQVAVENTTSLDVFGRHVNRAARVEALAGGGHIYLTFPVYDSAKGWIKNDRYVFTNHGQYSVKGIQEPIGIYEVFEDGIIRPKGPAYRSLRNRKRQQILLPVALIALLMMLTFIIYLGQRMSDAETKLLSSPTPTRNTDSFDDKNDPNLMEKVQEGKSTSRIVNESDQALKREDEKKKSEWEREKTLKKLEKQREKIKRIREKEREKLKRKMEKERTN
jgi:hypothetical protein